MACLQEEVEGLQWGKPGPGGAYWRNSAITGQGFFDKMVRTAGSLNIGTKHGDARAGVDQLILARGSTR